MPALESSSLFSTSITFILRYPWWAKNEGNLTTPITFIDHGPFAVGSLLVALAILFLIAASVEYQLILRRLGRENGRALGISTAQIAAIAITLLGMIALTSLFWRF